VRRGEDLKGLLGGLLPAELAVQQGKQARTVEHKEFVVRYDLQSGFV